MPTEETVFERTYKNYLEQLKGISFESIAPKLGAKTEGNALKIKLFQSDYLVSAERIAGPWGEKPAYDICVILSKYLLMCPEKLPENSGWVSFRDFKDSGPLVTYFQNDIERSIASQFAGNIDDLKKASNRLGGYPPDIDATYDYSIQFDALPMIPVIVLCNDTDEEFPATCSVLFESRADRYLDAECIAMLGRQLFGCLRKASR